MTTAGLFGETFLGEVGGYVDVAVSWDQESTDPDFAADPVCTWVTWEAGPDDQPGECPFEAFAQKTGRTPEQLMERVWDVWAEKAEKADEARKDRRHP